MRRPAQSVERAVFTDSTLILPMASLKTKKSNIPIKFLPIIGEKTIIHVSNY